MPKLLGFAPIDVRGPRALPFVGPPINAVRLVLGDPIGRAMALHREFGDIVAAADRSPAMVCAFGAALNREVLSNNAVFENDAEFFVKPPPGSPLAKFSRSLLFQTGEAHQRHRRLMMPAFQKSAIEGYASGIIAAAERMLDTWPLGRTVDVSGLLGALVERVAVRCFFGIDWEEGRRGLGSATAEMLELLTTPLTVALPLRIPGTPYARLLDVSGEVVAHLRAIIEKKRASGGESDDALARMIRARDQDDSAFSDDELIAEAATLYFSGQDTQAKTLGWTLFLLDQHPKIHGDLLDEIHGVLRGGPPSVELLPKLALTDRVIKESMRVLAPVPLLFIRVCQREARLGPYTLPVGANVILSPFVTHRDPNVYPEPARFSPERWERLSPTIYEYMPFGAGARMCIGASFATLALRLVLPMILQRYRLSLARGARISRRVRAQALGPKYGLPMTIQRQDGRPSRGEDVRGDIPELLDLR